jgi:hypothetical protein
MRPTAWLNYWSELHQAGHGIACQRGGIFFSRSDFHIFAWPDFPSININSFKINVIN